LTGLNNGEVQSDSNVTFINSVIHLHKHRRISVLIVNDTHKTSKLKADCHLALLNAVDHYDSSLITQHVSQSKGEPDFFDEVNVPENFSDSVRNLLKANWYIFAKDYSKLSVTNTIEMKIEPGDHPPIKSKRYRVQLKNMQAANDAIKNMLHAKIISRCHSSWNSSIVIVDKKDSTKRFCVDFRKLDKITQNTAYPLPRIDDIIAKLGKCHFFTSLISLAPFIRYLSENKTGTKLLFPHLMMADFVLIGCRLVYQIHRAIINENCIKRL
jgi:hypothetical protein